MLARSSFLAVLLLAALGACSTLPPATFPEFEDHHVAAEFVVSRDGRLLLPSTTRWLVVRELTLDPQPERERFDGGHRWFEYPAGTAVRVSCRLRAYANPDGRVPKLSEILVDARRIDVLEGP